MYIGYICNTPPNTVSRNTRQNNVMEFYTRDSISASNSKRQTQNTSKQVAFKYVKRINITLICIRYDYGESTTNGIIILLFMATGA